MPATHVALLRGINVGKAKRVAMADLRALMSALGHRDVRTLLNSGNVVFSAAGKAPAAEMAEQIERAIEKRLRLTSKVTVLTASELRDAIEQNPILNLVTEPSRHLVAVLASAAHRKHLDPLTKTDWSPEAFAVGRRVAYLWCPEGFLASRLQVALGRALDDAVTTRNWSTMLKLRTMLDA
jgi:uncharacterized protein (DUF1697 family)